MPKARHPHKYHRVTMNSQRVWACALGDCTHYMPKHMEQMLPGKTSVCWTCDKLFALHVNNMVEDMPRCDECRGIDTEGLADFLEQHGVK